MICTQHERLHELSGLSMTAAFIEAYTIAFDLCTIGAYRRNVVMRFDLSLAERDVIDACIIAVDLRLMVVYQ